MRWRARNRLTRVSADDPDTANDAAALAQRVKDDHFMWCVHGARLPHCMMPGQKTNSAPRTKRKGIDAKSVGAALVKIVASEKPLYDMSQVETFTPDWSSTHGLASFDGDAWFKDVYGVHHAQGGVGSKGC